MNNTFDLDVKLTSTTNSTNGFTYTETCYSTSCATVATCYTSSCYTSQDYCYSSSCYSAYCYTGEKTCMYTTTTKC